MKSIYKTMLVATAVSLFTLGSGYVVADNENELCEAIIADLQFNYGNICVSIKDGVATLSGNVETEVERNQAEKRALETDGVDKVINLITTK